MKAVLVGTDFMYRQDGRLVPIEINTNVAFDMSNRLETLNEVFNFDSLISFLKENNIKNVEFEGTAFKNIERILSRALEEEHISSSFVDSFSDEDSKNTLYVRSSYLDEAVVDSYCRDKFAFLSLIKNEEFGHQYLFGNGEDNLSSLPDNGNYPNSIVKYRYPNYANLDYPRFYKTSFEGVKSLDLEFDTFVMPFYYDESKLFEKNHIKLYRNWSIFVANDNKLQTLSIANYTKICNKLGDNLKYDETGRLEKEYESSFTTHADILDTFILVEKTDEILMADGTWKQSSEVKEGELVKSLKIDAYAEEGHEMDYEISFEELQASSSFVDAQLLRKVDQIGFIDKVEMVFEDGTSWFDTEKSSYLSIDPEDNSVRFVAIGSLQVGNKVILIDATKSELTYVIKVIVEIKKTRETVEGYDISLAGPYIFITRALGEQSAYASAEHNDCSCVCINGSPQCTSTEGGEECTVWRNRCSTTKTCSCMTS